MFCEVSDLEKHRKHIGNKALRLGELFNDGFSVPDFVVIPSNEIGELFLNDEPNDTVIENLLSEVDLHLGCKKYSVRSASLFEDSKVSAQAGKYKTVLDVSPLKLKDALLDVLLDAQSKVDKIETSFSVIIQKYIAPDYAGVVFSRNPLGGREMVLEYRHDVGSSVVEGQNVERIEYLYSNAKDYSEAFKYIEEIAYNSHLIESKYDFPQDVEWAVQDGHVYILQTRPITSISEPKWKGIKQAEALLKDKTYFYYEKTSITETFERPTPLSFSILEGLYDEKGPVQKAYKNLGVSFSPQDQFKFFGNELFVDKQLEVKTLLPSFGYLKYEKEKPQMETFKNGFGTFMNFLSLSKISFKSYNDIRKKIETILNEGVDRNMTIEESYAFLLENYVSIFQVNILAERALSGIKRFAKGNINNLPIETSGNECKIDTESLVGNSINIDDTSEFFSNISEIHEVSEKKDTPWWNAIPEIKKKAMLPLIKQFNELVELRELARILSVHLISQVRYSIESMGPDFSLDNTHIYFATINELIERTIDNEKIHARKDLYDEGSHLVMPKKLASFSFDSHKESKYVPISPGSATGTLLTTKDIDGETKEVVLYTETLHPDLVEYFSKVKGIVSKNGGILSHLAIMARESHVPVLVVDNLDQTLLNKKIRIDCNEGKLTILP